MGKQFVVSGAVRQHAGDQRTYARWTPEQQRAAVQTILANDLPESEKRVWIECVMAGAIVDLSDLRGHARMPGIAVGSAAQRAHAAPARSSTHPVMPGVTIGQHDTMVAHRGAGLMPGIRVGCAAQPGSRMHPAGHARMPGIDLSSLR